MLSSISKKLGSLMTQIIPVWLSRNPLGTILNLSQSTVSGGRHLREKQVYPIDHYLGKDTVNNILLHVLGIYFLGHFGTGVYRRGSNLYARLSVVMDVLNTTRTWCGQRHVAKSYIQVLSLIAMGHFCRMDKRDS